MKKSILFTCLVLYSFSVISSVSGYCSLCAGHIACNTTGDLSIFCPPDARVIPLGAQEINVLLDVHNGYRNTVASGLTPGLSSAPASRMMALSWDFELAWLAELNVMECRMDHDQCRSTVTFPLAGQNIYMHGTTGEFGPIENQLRGAVDLWYREYTSTTVADIRNCCGGERISAIGHFLQMVQDRAIRIGCAAARFTTVQWATTLVTCNYSFGNVLNQAVYQIGNPGSACRTRDSTFPNLCSA
ncbi:antigen 5 like allergen Cul n 1-like [Chironomus tepperi]|uniref:antigen 5 like allergen Cul n 1-like n=1 Tax=Chironomus tepperi TaxID=113505 RepID=UPI00391FBA2C